LDSGTGWLYNEENEEVSLKQNIDPNKKQVGLDSPAFFILS
jgi:hypothetical protein